MAISFKERLLTAAIRKLFSKLDTLYALPSNKTEATSDEFPRFISKCAVIYIHFPYCDSACRYCPFSKSLQSEESSLYCEALIKEIKLFKRKLDTHKPNIKALFFGGGTPSLIPISSLSMILDELRGQFGTLEQITMECNPESIDKEKLLAYRELGINRLTIGAQSFNPKILTELGREHSPELIEKAVMLAKECGFQNISIDLMYGFAQQEPNAFLIDLEKAIRLPINHISMFPLINSNHKERQALPSTLFAKQLKTYKQACDFLFKNSFKASSVEDFFKESEGENHYQKAVWEIPQEDMIILGTAGFGMAGAYNYSKEKRVKKFIAEIAKEEIPLSSCFEGSFKSLLLRRFFMGLHYNKISRSEFIKHYSVDPFKKFKLIILLLQILGLLYRKKNELYLTQTGRFVTSLIWAKVMLSRMSN